jgi:hypothetical protein
VVTAIQISDPDQLRGGDLNAEPVSLREMWPCVRQVGQLLWSVDEGDLALTEIS